MAPSRISILLPNVIITYKYRHNSSIFIAGAYVLDVQYVIKSSCSLLEARTFDNALILSYMCASDYPRKLRRMPAATAEPMTPATFGAIACISR